jgi:hypothetical protein
MREWSWHVSVQVAGTLIAAAVVYLVVVLAGVVTLNIAVAVFAVIGVIAMFGLAAWRASKPLSEEEVEARLRALQLEVDMFKAVAEQRRRDADAESDRR